MTWFWIALGAYLALLAVAAYVSVRPPRIPVFSGPGLAGFPQEVVEIPCGEGRGLPAWWCPAPGSRVVVILVHGYLMNRSELASLAIWLLSRGVSCLLPDQRAHGNGPSGPCGFGVRDAADIANAAREARKLQPGSKIILVGSSMGGAACAFALGEEPDLADALVLDCSYSRLWVAALGWWRFLGGRVLQAFMAPTLLIGPLFSRVNPFAADVAKSLTQLGDTPVLLFHGDRDTLVPPSEAERNLRACSGPAKLVWLRGCGHAEGRWLLPEEYLAELEGFLRECGVQLEPPGTKRPLP